MVSTGASRSGSSAAGGGGVYSQLAADETQAHRVDSLAYRDDNTDAVDGGYDQDGDDEEDLNFGHSYQQQHLPLIKNGVEGSLAWQRMGSKEKAMVFATFGLLGGGVLLPFNSIITPAEYFRSSFARTEFATTFSSWIVVSYNVVSILFGCHATATGGFERTSPRRRIILSSLIIMLAVLCFLISTTVHLYSDRAIVTTSPRAYFYLTIFLGCLLAAATAYLQNAVVALSTAFGAGGRFMGLMLTGQGTVGLGISIVGLVSAWSQSSLSAIDGSSTHAAIDVGGLTPAEETANEVARAATVFFGMSLGFMAVVLVAFGWLARSELYAQVMAKQIASIDKIDDRSDDGAGSDVEDRMTQSFHSERSISHPHYHSILKSVPGLGHLSADSRSSLLRLAQVQSKIAGDCFAVAFVFTITLSLFPALTSAVHSVYSTASIAGSAFKGSNSIDLTSPQIFVPFHFVLFNTADLFGRTLPSVAPRTLIRKTRVLVGASLARVVFVPLFLACHVVSSPGRTGPISSNEGDDGHQPATLPSSGLSALMQSSDAPFFATMLLFGFTSGLVSTSVMISGPSRSSLTNSKGASEGPLAAALLSFWLCVGLAAGSGLSFWTVPA